MPDDNISSTGDTALPSNFCFINPNFLLATICFPFVFVNVLIQPSLPHCKLNYEL